MTGITNFALQNEQNAYQVIPMSPNAPARNRYLAKSIVHSSQLLTAFRCPGETCRCRKLPLAVVCQRPWCFVFSILSKSAEWWTSSGRNSTSRECAPEAKALSATLLVPGCGFGIPVTEASTSATATSGRSNLNETMSCGPLKMKSCLSMKA